MTQSEAQQRAYLKLTALGMVQAVALPLAALTVKLSVLKMDSEILKAALRELDRFQEPGSVLRAEECQHVKWIDLRNEVIDSGEMCDQCGALRPGNAATG